MKRHINIKVESCVHACHFYNSSMDGMECMHPYFEDKGTYENMIITHENRGVGNFPEKCPLRREEVSLNYYIEVK